MIVFRTDELCYIFTNVQKLIKFKFYTYVRIVSLTYRYNNKKIYVLEESIDLVF